MTSLMLDLETLSTGPDACILTIAAQAFDPFGKGYFPQSYYARIDTESESARSIDNNTVEWWASQNEAAREEAFNPEDRIDLKIALDELGKLIWKSDFIWANGIVFDMGILEHAYKSYGMTLPFKYYKVRDARTIYSLYPDLPKPTTSHHALEDCRRQIDLLQTTFKHLDITRIS